MQTQSRTQTTRTSVQLGLMQRWSHVRSQRPDLCKPYLPLPGNKLINSGESFEGRIAYLVTTGFVIESIPFDDLVSRETLIIEAGNILFPQALDTQTRHIAQATYTVGEGTSLQPVSLELAQLLEFDIANEISKEHQRLRMARDLIDSFLMEIEQALRERTRFFPYFIRCAQLDAHVSALEAQLKEPEPALGHIANALIKSIDTLDTERIRLSAEHREKPDIPLILLFEESSESTSSQPEDEVPTCIDNDIPVRIEPDAEEEPSSHVSSADYSEKGDGTSILPLPLIEDFAQSGETSLEDLHENEPTGSFITQEFVSPPDDPIPDTDNIQTVRPPPPLQLTDDIQQASSETEPPSNHSPTLFGPDPELCEQQRDTIAGLPIAPDIRPVARPSPVSVRRGDIPHSNNRTK